MRTRLWILWLCLVLAVLCLLWVISTTMNIRESADACHTGACSAFVGKEYTGYDTAFILQEGGSNEEIQKFCKRINGNYDTIYGGPNYFYNSATSSFSCKDPRNPTLSISDINDPLKIYHFYNTTDKSFSKNDWLYNKPQLLSEMTDFCKKINGGKDTITNSLGGIEPNYRLIQDKDNNFSFYCKSIFDNSLDMITMDSSYAIWSKDKSTEPKKYYSLDKVNDFCKTINGNHDQIVISNNVLPLSTFKEEDTEIKFDCTSFWTGKPIISAEKEKVMYLNKDIWGTDLSFSKLEDVRSYCSTWNPINDNFIIFDSPDNDKYSFSCRSKFDGSAMTKADLSKQNTITDRRDLKYSFNNTFNNTNTKNDIENYCKKMYNNDYFVVFRNDKFDESYYTAFEFSCTQQKQ